MPADFQRPWCLSHGRAHCKPGSAASSSTSTLWVCAPRLMRDGLAAKAATAEAFGHADHCIGETESSMNELSPPSATSAATWTAVRAGRRRAAYVFGEAQAAGVQPHLARPPEGPPRRLPVLRRDSTARIRRHRRLRTSPLNIRRTIISDRAIKDDFTGQPLPSVHQPLHFPAVFPERACLPGQLAAATRSADFDC